MKRKLLLILAFTLILFPLGTTTLANKTTESVQQNNPIKVITISLLEKHLTEIIGSDRVAVTSILGYSQSPYGYVPSVEDTIAVAEADILFSIDFEYLLTQSYTFVWLEGLLNASENNDLIQVDLSRNVTMRIDPVMGTINHHIWTNPLNVKIIVEDIANELIKLDPSYENVYKTNLESYQNELDQLIEDITTQAAPYNGTKVVTVSSQSWPLLDLIGFEKVGQIVLTSAAQVTAEHLESIITLIKNENITLLVNDYPGHPPDGVATILEDTGVKIVKFDSDTGLSQTYLGIINLDVDRLVNALKDTTKNNNDNTIPGFGWNLVIINIIPSAIISLVYFRKKNGI
ncbi:MAG: metal ABC transporter substrate-binding protein [Candidatus Hodarchaeales archaeon]|jgi:ABC-type Zn uptake system ZnuABC Zn-binding protein ZnuA